MGKMLRVTLLWLNILTDWCASLYLLVCTFVNKSLDLGRETDVDPTGMDEPPVGSGGNEGYRVQRGLCGVHRSDQEGKGLRGREAGKWGEHLLFLS